MKKIIIYLITHMYNSSAADDLVLFWQFGLHLNSFLSVIMKKEND